MIEQLKVLLGEMETDATEYARRAKHAMGSYVSYYEGKAKNSEEYAGKLKVILEAWKKREEADVADMLAFGKGYRR